MAEASVEVSPVGGQALLYTQGGPGVSPGYGALDRRRWLAGAAPQPGVFDSDQWKVDERGAGATLSVDIENPDTGYGVARVGNYVVAPHQETANLAPPSGADATNPRIDSVFLVAHDHDVDGLGDYTAEIVYIEGTPTAGADLDDRLGAPDEPTAAAVILLADVLVGAGAASILAANIRDRRTRAHGANLISRLTAATATTSATEQTAIAAQRVELSGVPVEIVAAGGMQLPTVAAQAGLVAVSIDGAAIVDWHYVYSHVSNASQPFNLKDVQTLTAGSHTFSVKYRSRTGDNTEIANADHPLTLHVRELPA